MEVWENKKCILLFFFQISFQTKCEEKEGNLLTDCDYENVNYLLNGLCEQLVQAFKVLYYHGAIGKQLKCVLSQGVF